MADSYGLYNENQVNVVNKPSFAFQAAGVVALLIGMGGFLVALYYSKEGLTFKGFFATLLLYGLFAAISVQKNVRDRLEGLKITPLYYGLSWFSVVFCIVFAAISLFNMTIGVYEKAFFGAMYGMALFAAVVVQKNVRDLKA